MHRKRGTNAKESQTRAESTWQAWWIARDWYNHGKSNSLSWWSQQAYCVPYKHHCITINHLQATDTRKRVRQVALQRNDVFRGTFIAHCSLFSRDKFVWLDETGSDNRDHVRKYGYALRGMRPVTHHFLSRGRRTNAIAAMSQDGMIALELVSGAVNGDIFFDFVSSSLIPMMMPFNGINSRSVLIMDNCSVHHVNEVKSLLQQAGIITLYLPPYSSDFIPAEEAFSYVKGYLRKHDNLLQAGAPLQYILQAAFESITDKHCESWINDCGYA